MGWDRWESKQGTPKRGPLKRCLRLLGGLLISLAAGCAREHRPEDMDDLARRVAVLEREVRELRSARHPAPEVPSAQGRAGNTGLQSLREKRRQLLRVYTERHPAVKLLDQEIFELEHHPGQP